MAANRAQRRQQEREARKAEKQQAKAAPAMEMRELKTLLGKTERGRRFLNEAGLDRIKYELDAKQAAKARLERNGITAEDLKRNYDLGWQDGFQEGQEATTKVVLAALCMALHEQFGFGTTRCHRVLTDTINRVIYNMDSKEAVDEVYEKIGLRIRPSDPIDPIEEVAR